MDEITCQLSHYLPFGIRLCIVRFFSFTVVSNPYIDLIYSTIIAICPRNTNLFISAYQNITATHESLIS